MKQLSKKQYKDTSPEERSEKGPERNIIKGTKIVVIKGVTYQQTEMTNGNIRNTRVFPGDYPEAGAA